MVTKILETQSVTLTLTMLEQLQSYVDHRDDPDRGGWYYGNREQFEKRHAAIREWLTQEVCRHKEGNHDGRKDKRKW